MVDRLRKIIVMSGRNGRKKAILKATIFKFPMLVVFCSMKYFMHPKFPTEPVSLIMPIFCRCKLQGTQKISNKTISQISF